MNRFSQLLVFISVFTSLPLLSQKDAPANSPASPEGEYAPLPEVLLSFEAVLNDQRVELTWSSNTEYNNHHFTIERSKDGIAFEELLKIRNFGNYSNIISYFDTDNKPYKGISYYRLTQTNALGHILSSRVVLINNKGDHKPLELANGTAGDAQPTANDVKEALVVLRNEKGEERFSKVWVDTDNTIRVPSDNDSKLNNGTYLIIASSDNQLYSKVLKVQ